MQINIIRHNGGSHQCRNGHPVAAVRNFEAEEAAENGTPVGFCREGADQENDAHQDDESCQEIFDALIAS